MVRQSEKCTSNLKPSHLTRRFIVNSMVAILKPIFWPRMIALHNQAQNSLPVHVKIFYKIRRNNDSLGLMCVEAHSHLQRITNAWPFLCGIPENRECADCDRPRLY